MLQLWGNWTFCKGLSFLKKEYKENNSLEVDPGVLKDIMVIEKDVYEKLLFF